MELIGLDWIGWIKCNFHGLIAIICLNLKVGIFVGGICIQIRLLGVFAIICFVIFVGSSGVGIICIQYAATKEKVIGIYLQAHNAVWFKKICLFLFLA